MPWDALKMGIVFRAREMWNVDVTWWSGGPLDWEWPDGSARQKSGR